MSSNITRKKIDLLAHASISLDWLRTQSNIFAGGDAGIFHWGGGGPNFGSERTVECKLLFATLPPSSHWEGERRLRVSQLWKPVAVGPGNTQTTKGTQRQSHFWISLEFSLVAKYNTRFIKKFSQLNSDIQSYRCKDFSLEQVSTSTWLRKRINIFVRCV